MNYAAIDVGSNSCRLLIAEFVEGKIVPLHRELETTRIAAGLNHTGKISEEAMERSLQCLESFRKRITDYGVSRYRAIATSAVREARNGQDFIALVKQRCQLDVDIVSGEEEARLSYMGVEKGLPLNHAPLVVDLGGGSTEFICNEQDLILSIPLGAVRATELEMTEKEISVLLAEVARIADNFRDFPLVMVGGTASSLVAIKLGMDEYDASRVHGQRLTREDLYDLYHLLDKTPLSLRKRMPGLQPERADIINKGALIILMIVNTFKKSELIVSEADLLQGMLWAADVLKKIS